MKLNLHNFLNHAVIGELELDDGIFGVEPRKDILFRVVHWQLAKRRQGTHNTKEIGDVRGSTKKIYKQKGTGGARHGSKRGPQFRGGAIIFGPHPRDYAYDLPKKIRRLGLRMALADKILQERLMVVESLSLDNPKTSHAVSILKPFSNEKVLLIDREDINQNLALGVSNLHKVDILPQIGANVYDILNKDWVVISQDAIKALEARLK